MSHSASITEILQNFPEYRNESTANHSYGTAGFRMHAELLPPICFRIGMLSALRSHAESKAVGCVVTASHNPECDNGIKLIDPMGEMLEASWESHATDFTNSNDSNLSVKVSRFKETICNSSMVSNNHTVPDGCLKEHSDDQYVPVVLVAMDTRPSGPQLVSALKAGVTVVGGVVDYHGMLTTPQLHYLVRCTNDPNYGNATVEGYVAKLTNAFKEMRLLQGLKGVNTLYVDCANGVGALALEKFAANLNDCLNIVTFNTGDNELNKDCGADYVRMKNEAPSGFDANTHVRCCSFDGDADRILFYFADSAGLFHLLDGDKIASLLAIHIKDLLQDCSIDLEVGVVQTAYASCSSTNFLQDVVKVKVVCAKTGVKHLHDMAIQFDIGVYFEANGHGTVVYSEQALFAIQASHSLKLRQFIQMTNQTVGDAISVMLLVETVLASRQMSFSVWDSLYTELPSLQLKVKVKDRSVIQTTDAERRATTPVGFQQLIDGVVCKYENGRSFVRPSGTEDVVRVFAEAASTEEVLKLAHAVALLVYANCGGVGEPPNSIAQFVI